MQRAIRVREQQEAQRTAEMALIQARKRELALERKAVVEARRLAARQEAEEQTAIEVRS